MSIPQQPPEFDFWEFVECTKCHLPFISGSQNATIPFWLTECGHVICNSHLNPDQSCTSCGSKDVQVVPLQQEMDPPMSDWFRSAPYALDTIAYSIKFQQESMASQIRYYKSRHYQQRMYIEKIRHENAQLKQEVEMLSIQLQQMNVGHYCAEEPSEIVNANGKRQMVESHRSSSPRSAHTPVGPNRITLPPGQQPPHLSSKTSPEQVYSTTQRGIQPDRPGTRSFNDKFSYHVSHAQAAPRQFQHTRPNQENQAPGPPVLQTKFKPVQPATNLQSQQVAGQRKAMAPPPTPQRARQPTHRAQNDTSSVSSNRFLPPEQRFAPPRTNASDNQNMPPPANGSRRFAPPLSGSRAPSRAALPSTVSGGQRIPFVPSNSGSFG